MSTESKVVVVGEARQRRSSPDRCLWILLLAFALLLPAAAQRGFRRGGAGARAPVARMPQMRNPRPGWQPRQPNNSQQAQQRRQQRRAGLGQALAGLQQLPPEQREARLTQDPNFQKLPPGEQQQMLNRLRWFNNLPPDRQNKVIARMQHLGELNPQQRQGLEQIYQSWKQMPPERRQALRGAYHRLSQLPPDRQQEILARPQFQQRFSADERNLLQNALSLNLPDDVIGSAP